MSDQQPASAVIEESFVPQALNVFGREATQDTPATVSIRFLTGPYGNNAEVFIAAKIATLDPNLAVQLGEHLVKEGSRLKSGIVLPH